jgi:surface-anchored protein
MNRSLSLLLLVVLAQTWALAQTSLPPTNFVTLDHEHTDGLCLLYNPTGSNLLSLIAWQRDAGLDLPTNQVIFVAKTQAMLTLPAGTPFGSAGQPFWILPQSQNPNLLYLGVNSERIPSGVFTGPLTIQLKRMVGPGYFMVWQATGPGQYNIRVNTRDGISTNDNFMPLIGSHEHFNWGFSTTGVYCATFQAFGQRIGETTNIFSPESTFLFQILPLPPPTNYSTWAKGYWPPAFNPPTTQTNGNPDGDLFNNLTEYAFNLSPTNANAISNAPLFSFVAVNSQKHGALTFTRFKPALDLNYTVEATSTLPDGWSPLMNIFSVLPNTNGLTELVTMNDSLATTNRQRFFRLRVWLNP